MKRTQSSRAQIAKRATVLRFVRTLFLFAGTFQIGTHIAYALGSGHKPLPVWLAFGLLAVAAGAHLDARRTDADYRNAPYV